MSKYGLIDIGDKHRALITDVLPYELPIWYSPYAFHSAIKRNEGLYLAAVGYDNMKNVPTIPMNYDISRGGGKKRTLSVMHLAHQLLVANFYEKYKEVILYYCGRSKCSLRHPVKIASSFYGKWTPLDKSKEGVEVETMERKVGSSYFRYGKYSFLYNYFDSYEYHRIESKFDYMMQLDIARCFSNMYTHSIGWAVKGKSLSKAQARGGFDDELDVLIRNVNHQETAGIIIGPEFSRIIAEVVLQRIDNDIIRILDRDHGLASGVDYDFRRYVDDYFFYFKDRGSEDKILVVVEAALSEYKLHLNESKKITSARPFSTPLSRAKRSLKELIGSMFLSRFLEDGGLKKSNFSGAVANRRIALIKGVCADYGVEYSSVCGYIISVYSRRLMRFLSKLSEGDEAVGWILADVEVILFFYMMDLRVVTTDKVSKIFVSLIDRCNEWDEGSADLVYKKIHDGCVLVLKESSYKIGVSISGVEMLNILFLHSRLPSKYSLSLGMIEDFYEKACSSDSPYFIWVSFMLYASSRRRELVDKLVSSGEEYLLENIEFSSSEYIHFLMDFLSCPHVKKVIRTRVLNVLKEGHSDKFCVAVRNRAVLLSNDFIAPWRDPDFLKNALKKREFIFPY